MKFKCKDIGQNCKFEIQDENRDEMMALIAMHAEKTHNIKPAPPELVEKIKKAIKK